MSSQTGETTASTMPRAVIHKKILDAAKSHPDKSIDELATTVNGASEGLIERVLDEYGDPAEGDQPTTGQGYEPSENQQDMSKTKIDGNATNGSAQQTREIERKPAEITEKQWEALHAIRNQPDATQADLAEQFGVTQSTINSRLNSIEGFDWEHRQEFVESVLDDADSPRDETASSSVPVQDLVDQVEDLAEQIAALDQRLADRSTSARSPFGDPDLASKIVRACVNDDDITEDEEMQILKKVITSTDPSK